MSAPRARSARAAAPRASRGRTGSRDVASTSSGRPSSDTTDSSNTPLLLDSHVWVWLLAGNTAQLSSRVVAQIERAALAQECHVSDISAWEVADHCNQQTLTLSMEVGAWLDQASRAPGIATLPVSRDLLIASTRLPGDELSNHADRILVATAQKFGLTLVTCDPPLIAFARTWPGLGILDARA